MYSEKRIHFPTVSFTDKKNRIIKKKHSHLLVCRRYAAKKVKDTVRELIFPNLPRRSHKVWPKNEISTRLPSQDLHRSTVEQCERQGEARESDERQAEARDANERQAEEGQCQRQSVEREANERQPEAREKQREADGNKNKIPAAIGEDVRAKLNGETLPERFLNLSYI